MNVFTPEFWEKQWNEAIRQNETKSNSDKIAMWNTRAEKFDENVSSESGQQRISATCNFLDHHGALDAKNTESKSLEILDIGCGPGQYALEFAKRGHTVYALDPAEKMIDKLKEKLQNQNEEVASRIIPMAEDWLELDIDELGFENKFDLVFASMSPGIRDAASLRKAIKTSNRYCYLSKFSGAKFRKSVATIFKKYLGDRGLSPMDLYFPLNWLYTAGYKPILTYESWNRDDPQPVEEAKQEIKQMVGMRLTVDSQVEDDIDQYIREHQRNGYLTESKGATSGMLLFNVNDS